LQLGPLMVHQSFQHPAEAFLVGIPLEGGFLFSLRSLRLVFCSFHFGPTSFGDDTSHKWDYHLVPVWRGVLMKIMKVTIFGCDDV
jgi:hypothetical protein